MARDFDPRDYGFDPDADRSYQQRRTPGSLPDPEMHAGFYEDVTKKRFGAWIVDTILIGLLTGLVVIFTAFLTIVIAPAIFLIVSFMYRWISIGRHSSTPGMRLMGIELRNSDGNRLDGSMAFLHTLGYSISFATFIIQLLSIGLMMTSNNGKGLSDVLLGTAMINSVARS
ncbi:RDD family protein [Falsihalocynthiibacter sp. SS001]|uniref:RDD family protein n=1 Tax=Falsihalocynthiibacter sp. SS001 TaxID=3349698 RepID=UPI0036D2B74F